MIQELISGLAMGCVYALVSFGFVLVYNAVGAVNFAHGELVMFGGYFGLIGTSWLHLPLWLALLFSLMAMAGLGIVYNRVAYYPMRHRPVATVIIASIGMSILLRNSALALFGPDPLKLRSFLGEDIFRLGGVVIPQHHVLIIGVTLALFIGQSLLIVILKAFIVIVIGGFGSVRGLLAGGLFLGVVEVLVASHLTSEYRDAISFLILIAVLIVLPRGFFGEKIAQNV
jgi:branched-subunit amino acid ABC-type transport system permease component